MNGDLIISLSVPSSFLIQKENAATLVMEEEVLSRGGGEITGFYLLPSKIDATAKRINGTLRLNGQDAVGSIPRGNAELVSFFGGSPRNVERQAGTTSVTISAQSGWLYDIYSSQHFRVSYRGKLVDSASVKEFVAILEDQRQKIETFGFRFGGVTMTDIYLETMNQVSGEFVPSSMGGAYCTIKISNKFFYTPDLFNANKEIIKATAGHELLHLAQFMMDPRYAYTKAKKAGATKTLWMDEAVSTWYETRASGNPGLVPENTGKFRYFFQTALLAPPIDKAQDHGYGASVFLRYLTKKYGDTLLVDIYKQLQKGTTTGTAAEAFQKTLDAYKSSPGIEWTPFLETLVTAPGSLYIGYAAPSIPKISSLMSSPSVGKKDNDLLFRISTPLVENRKSETVGTQSAGTGPSVTFNFQQAGLTADMFYVNLPPQGAAGEPFSTPGLLTVQVNAPEYAGVLVYGIPLGADNLLPLAGAPFHYLSSGDVVSQSGSKLVINVNSPNPNGKIYQRLLFIPFNNHSDYQKPEEKLSITLQLTYMPLALTQPPQPTVIKTRTATVTPRNIPTTVIPGDSSHVCAGMTLEKLKSPLGHTTKCWLTCFQIEGAKPTDAEIQTCINRYK